ILVSNLAAIGIDVKVTTTKGEPYDIASAGWVNDGFFDPYDFLNVFFDGNLASAGSYSPNLSHFDDPVYNRRLEAAAKPPGPARYTTYARLDADLAKNAAPIIAWGTPRWQELLSARMGCQIYNVSYGMDFAALCIRGQTRR